MVLTCALRACKVQGRGADLQETQSHNACPAKVKILQALAVLQLAETSCTQAFAALQAQPLQSEQPCTAAQQLLRTNPII